MNTNLTDEAPEERRKVVPFSELVDLRVKTFYEAVTEVVYERGQGMNRMTVVGVLERIKLEIMDGS